VVGGSTRIKSNKVHYIGGSATCTTWRRGGLLYLCRNQRVVTCVHIQANVVIPPLSLNAREVCAEKLAIVRYFDTPPQTVALCRGLIVCWCLCVCVCVFVYARQYYLSSLLVNLS
jgi:hypothetical protein